MSIAFESNAPFDETVQRCRESPTAEGFGVLTEIDILAPLRLLATGYHEEP